MRKVFTSEINQTELLKKGYTTISLLDSKEVNDLLTKVKEMIPDEKHNGYHQTGYHSTYQDTDIEYRRRAHHLIREVFEPKVNKQFVDYKILASNFVIKAPGAGKIHIHLHPQYSQDVSDTTVTIWCPLVDVNETNGTLQVIEGSHKLVPYIVGYTYKHFFHGFEDALCRKFSTPIPLKAGESVIFDDSLIHWSEKNNSNSPRYALQITCVPAEIMPVMYFNDPKAAEMFEIFEVGTDFFTDFTAGENKNYELKKIASVKNLNKEISEKEFIKLLKRGDEIRSRIYSGNNGIKQLNLWDRFTSLFKHK